MDRGTILSLTAPAVVLLMGFYTRKVLLSLLTGIALAALIASDFQLLDGAALMVQLLWDSSGLNMLLHPTTFLDSWNAFICLFLLILGITINLIHRSGGALAYEGFIRSKFKDRKKVEASSLLMSKCLCIDDYFSSLTVGSVMRSITDSYRIPRAKLAFLVDAMSAPLAILCPVSSWVAAIVGYLKDNGIHASPGTDTKILASPFLTYLNMIPFIFYSFTIIFSVWFIVLRRISFGLMGRHEAFAIKTGNVFNGKHGSVRPERGRPEGQHTSMIDFFVPVSSLILSVLIGILWSGSWQALPGGTRSFVDAMREASAAQGLLFGGLTSLILTLIFYLHRKKIALSELPAACSEGFRMMAPSCLILIFAWTLGGLLRDQLHTGHYIARILTGRLPIELVPAMAFASSAAISFAIGSSWGTASIMLPIGIQLVLTMAGAPIPTGIDQVPLLLPTLGAVLSGCVAGDHISPISDTTIMSSTSTAMEHIDHVETQMSYAIPIITITGISFLVLGYTHELGSQPSLICGMSSSIIMTLVIFSTLHKKKFGKSVNPSKPLLKSRAG